MEKGFKETLVMLDAYSQATIEAPSECLVALNVLEAKYRASMIRNGFLAAANLLSELEMGLSSDDDLWLLARYEDRLKLVGFESARLEEITRVVDMNNQWPPASLGKITNDFLQDLAEMVTSIADSETRYLILNEYDKMLQLAGYSTHYSAVEIDTLRKELENDLVSAIDEAFLEEIAEESKVLKTSMSPNEMSSISKIYGMMSTVTEISNINDKAFSEESEENQLTDSDTSTIIEQDISEIVDNDANEVSLVSYNDVIKIKKISPREVTNETTSDVEYEDALDTSIALVCHNGIKETPTEDAVEGLNQSSSDLFSNRGVDTDASIVASKVLSNGTHKVSCEKTDKDPFGTSDDLTRITKDAVELQQLQPHLDDGSNTSMKTDDDADIANVNTNKVLDDDVIMKPKGSTEETDGSSIDEKETEAVIQQEYPYYEPVLDKTNETHETVISQSSKVPDVNLNDGSDPALTPAHLYEPNEDENRCAELIGLLNHITNIEALSKARKVANANDLKVNDCENKEVEEKSVATDDNMCEMVGDGESDVAADTKEVASNSSVQNVVNASPFLFTVNETPTWKLIRLDSPPPPIHYRKTRKIDDKRPMDPRIKYVLKSVPIEERVKRVARRRLPKPTPLDWFSSGLSPPSDFYYSGLYSELPLSCKAYAFSERLRQINVELVEANAVQDGLLRREYHDVVSAFETHLNDLRAERPAETNVVRRRPRQPNQEEWRRNLIIWLFCSRDRLPGGLRFSPLNFTQPLTVRASAIADRMKWVETRLGDADPQQALILINEFNQVAAAIHQPYHYPVPGEVPPDDSLKPLPPDLEELRVRKNRALKDYRNWPSPEYKVTMRKLQDEFKRRLAIYRASEEGQA